MNQWARSRQIYAALEGAPDLSRGQMRLAAEVALMELRGIYVPTYAHERAIEALAIMAGYELFRKSSPV